MVFVGSYGFNLSTRLSWIRGIGDDDPIAMSESGSLFHVHLLLTGYVS